MEASPEVGAVIRGWFEAVSTGDPSWVDRHVSRQPSVRLVGTDPNEWLQGEAVAGFMRTEASNLAGMATFAIGEVEAYREGSVGWGLARPQITFSDGTVVSPRWSGIFHQEEGSWKLVQLHASIGLGNEEIGFNTQP